jgi:DNA-3-methyladenine glycosylase I
MAGGKPIQNTGEILSQSPLSAEMSKAFKKRGFKFVGPVIVYAWMQAVGIVNDHAAHCFRSKAVRKFERKSASAHATGPGAGSAWSPRHE